VSASFALSDVRPSLGAYFASRPLPLAADGSHTWNIYATPAAISIGFLVVETLMLIVKLPETRNWKKTAVTSAGGDKRKAEVQRDSAESRLTRLKMIGWYHCAFLLFFSGVSETRLSKGREWY